jgi:hypothetical protein
VPAGWQPRRRPSFDRIGGGYPTVDLHVADVPYGALSRAQVSLQASPKGWLPTAALSCCVATAILAIAAWRQPHTTNDVASALLVGFAAAMLAVLVRPDPHRMVTRLLSGLRNLALVSALLSFASAVVFTFYDGDGVQTILFLLALISAGPSGLVTFVWLRTRYRRPAEEESPWEQHKPHPDALGPEHRPYLDELITLLETEDRPYTVGLERLGFLKPAIRVASSESAREEFRWDAEFDSEFVSRLAD